MTPERWQQVMHVLDAVILLDTTERDPYLDKVCADDPELRVEVESLVDSHKRAGSDFLNASAVNLRPPVVGADPARARLGHRIGAYEVLEEIGHGGMGEVYRAVRADGQYTKKVALKLVRGGASTVSVLERFRYERQILAGLDHPNIARLLDGGTTEDGVPYLVMELVEGMPLDKFCDSRLLSITQRIELFRQVCAAVQYAHQRLVIHRDLKPGNILVSEDGAPKLVDFGIAKILDPSSAVETTFSRAMTPQYASPEQIRGESITTSTDVYSLGVVLYQLLTGHSPYRVGGRASHELSRAIIDTEPERPSLIVLQGQEVRIEGGAKHLTAEDVSHVRGSSPRRLRRRLSGDLDNILLKALRKEPERRYASVEQFDEDLRRHLAGLPVTALKDSWGYRALKFTRRHTVATLSTIVACVALILGTSMIVYESRVAAENGRRAERRFNDVRQLAKSLMFGLHDSIADIPGSTNARHLLVTTSLEYLDRLREDVGNDASLQKELANAYERVGDVQGNPYVANLGDTPGALASYRKALSVRTSLLNNDPRNSTLKAQLSGVYWKMGICQDAASDFSGSIASLQQALALSLSAGATPGDLIAQDRLAGDYWAIASAQRKTGDLTDALENYRKAASMHEAAAATNPGKGSAPLLHSSGDYYGMAKVLAGMGRKAEATDAAKRSVSVLRSIAKGDPNNATIGQYLADSLEVEANCLEEEQRLGQALESYRAAKDIYERAMLADAKDSRSSRLLGYTDMQVGRVLVKEGNVAAGLPLLQSALRIFSQLAEKMPHSTYISNNFANIYMELGNAHSSLASSRETSISQRRAQWLEARKWYEKSRVVWLALQRQGQLAISEKNQPDLASQKIKGCELALARPL